MLPLVRSRVHALLSSQVQVVLATTTPLNTPATALMAFVPSQDFKSIYLATPISARKAKNMLNNDNVSLLWDNRTGNSVDHSGGLLATCEGTATQSTGDILDSHREIFLARNPNMTVFLASDGVAIFEIKVKSYEVVEGYGKPEQWVPDV